MATSVPVANWVLSSPRPSTPVLATGTEVAMTKMSCLSLRRTTCRAGHCATGDRLDTLSATQAQPDPQIASLVEKQKSFGLNGEPPRNRTENPQIKTTNGARPMASAPYFGIGFEGLSVLERPLVS